MHIVVATKEDWMIGVFTCRSTIKTILMFNNNNKYKNKNKVTPLVLIIY